MSFAHATASRRPLWISTPNQITRDAAVQRANKNGNPIQLFPLLLMIACITFGPIIEDARFDKPKRPKNWKQWESEIGINAGATHHIIEAGRSEFSHHGLREGIIWCLENAKYNIVEPTLKSNNFPGNISEKINQNSQTLWYLKRRWACELLAQVSNTHPMVFVQIPIIPHRGMRIVTTFVTTNIFFVLIFQYFWIYQNPNVLAVDVIACAKPRYVFCRKLNENLSFWHIKTRVPVVFRPCVEMIEIFNTCEGISLKRDIHTSARRKKAKI